MKNFYRSIFSLFVFTVLVLFGCTSYSDGSNNGENTTLGESSSDMGFIISFANLAGSRSTYYTIDEVSFFKIQVSLNSNVVVEKTAGFDDTIKIGLTKEGLYTIAITAYNSKHDPIADGSTQKYLYYDSGYQRVSISITPYSKTINVIVDVKWVQPSDETTDTYKATFIVNDESETSDIFYSKSVSSSSENYSSYEHYSFFTDDIPVPTRSGYLFNGWYSDKECLDVVRTHTIFTNNDIKHGYYMSADTTYYAKWVETPNLIWSGSEFLRTKKVFDSSYFESFNQAGTFTVYYHNDSPDSKNDSISLYAGSTQIYTKNVNICGSGYASFSFNLTEENLALLKSNGLTVSSSSYYDFYLRGLAFAEGETYTETGNKIIYNLNGGKNHPSNPSIFSESDYIYLQSPTYAGYKFCGWYENENFSGNSISYISGNERNADVELWAKWQETPFVPFPEEAVVSTSGVYTTTLIKEGIGNGWASSEDCKFLKIVLAPRDVVAKMINGEIIDEYSLFTDENMCYVYANNNVGNAKITVSNLSEDTYLQPCGVNGEEYTGLGIKKDNEGNYIVIFDITKINKDILLTRSHSESNEDVWENKGNIESDYVPMILGCVTSESSCYPFYMWGVGLAILEPTEEAFPENINKEVLPTTSSIKYIYGNLTDWNYKELTNNTYEFTYSADTQYSYYDDYLEFLFYSDDHNLRMGDAVITSFNTEFESVKNDSNIRLPISMLTKGTKYVITFTATGDYTATVSVCPSESL